MGLQGGELAELGTQRLHSTAGASVGVALAGRGAVEGLGGVLFLLLLVTGRQRLRGGGTGGAAGYVLSCLPARLCVELQSTYCGALLWVLLGLLACLLGSAMGGGGCTFEGVWVSASPHPKYWLHPYSALHTMY